jgi:hypothetical protein
MPAAYAQPLRSSRPFSWQCHRKAIVGRCTAANEAARTRAKPAVLDLRAESAQHSLTAERPCHSRSSREPRSTWVTGIIATRQPLQTHIAQPMPDACSERPSAIHAPAFGDDPEMLITLRCGGLNSGTRYRPRTRWHNHRSTGVTLSNCTINVVSVVSPIASEWSDWTRRSIEQRPDLRAVIDIVRGQLRRDDFTSVGVRAKI